MQNSVHKTYWKTLTNLDDLNCVCVKCQMLKEPVKKSSLKSLRLRKLLTFGYVWFLPYSPYFAYLSLPFLSFPYPCQALLGLTGPY